MQQIKAGNALQSLTLVMCLLLFLWLWPMLYHPSASPTSLGTSTTTNDPKTGIITEMLSSQPTNHGQWIAVKNHRIFR